MKLAPTSVFVVLGFWLFTAAIVVVEVFPYKPSSLLGWMVLIVGGPPAYLIVQGVGEVLFSKIEQRLSLKRILVFLLITGLFGATLYVSHPLGLGHPH